MSRIVGSSRIRPDLGLRSDVGSGSRSYRSDPSIRVEPIRPEFTPAIHDDRGTSQWHATQRAIERVYAELVARSAA